MAGGAPFQLTVGGTDYFAAYSGGSAETPYIVPDTVSMENDADGGGATLSFEVTQEVTPAAGPWFATVADNAVVKFIDTSLATDTTLLAGFLGNIDANLNGGGQGTVAQVSCLAPSSLLDRIVVWKGKQGTLRGGVVSTIIYKSGLTDLALLTSILALVNTQIGAGISDLFNPASVASVTSTATINEKVEIPLGTLRAALDTVKELAEATDGIARRYYIDPRTKRLVYGKAPAASIYATAPFKIITAGIDAPQGGTATASTLLVRDLKVTYNHEDSRKRVFVLAGDALYDGDTEADPYVRTYTQTGIAFPARSGAMVTDEILDAPSIKGSLATAAKRADRQTKITTAARAFFTTRYKPVQTIEFTVRGAGTATGQVYGFGAGTAQTGAATYAYVDRWEPGQFVRIDAAGLGLADVFRVESVSMSFEAGSLVRRWDIKAERRRRGKLSQIIL